MVRRRRVGVAPSSGAWRWVVLLAPAVALTWASWVALRGNHVDYDVYVRAGLRVIRSESLYDTEGELPFTYPPFAALLAAGFAVLPIVGLAVLSALTVVAAVWPTVHVLDRAGSRPPLVALVVALTGVSEPVLRGLHLGQVNGLVIGLVLVDVLLVPTRRRGFLVGLAAGIKLTPLVLLLHFAVRREWASLARCLAGFGATVAVGLLVLPSDSVRFWGGLFVDSARVGNPGFVDNQSLLGLAERLDQASPTLLWLGGALVVLVAGAALARRLRDADPLESVLACLLVGLLVSPISWSHHWIVLPALSAMLLVRGRASGHRVLQAVGWLGLGVAVAAPHWWLDARVHESGPAGALDQLLASSMVGVGVLLLALLLLGSRVSITAAPAVDKVLT